MKNKLNILGIIPNTLIIIAMIMAINGIPNQLIVMAVAVLIMIFGTSTIFLIQQNRVKPSTKWLNILAYISLFIFLLSYYMYLVNFPMLGFIPFGIISLISGMLISLYIFHKLFKKLLSITKLSFLHHFILFIILLYIALPVNNQLADKYYYPNIENPAYKENNGPLIYFDAGHNNFHTLDGRLYSTGHLLEQDGYRVLSYNQKIQIDSLAKCKIYAIFNSLNKDDNDSLPTKSAFTQKEISDIVEWVKNGGSLFLVADHMPFAGAASDLASKFGFEYENGHAEHFSDNPDYFYRANKTLGDNAITNGRNSNENIDSILTFRGSAIKIPQDATPILSFDTTWKNFNPNIAWEYKGIEPFSINGYSQGAYKEYGKGRVVVFGEAMMFTAQLGGGLSFIKIGMSSSNCPDNHKLLLNIIHWLDGLI